MGKGVLVHCCKGLLNYIGGKALGDCLFEEVKQVAKDVYDCVRKSATNAEIGSEIGSLAKGTHQEAESAARQVATEIMEDQRLLESAGIDKKAEDPEFRQGLKVGLADILSRIPSTVRRSLRRPSDPLGSTLPTGFALRAADDIIPFLPMRMPRFKEGQRIAGLGDWELVELLGIGGFGEVWKARNHFLPNHPPVALKFCLDPKAAASLRNEAKLLDRVREGSREGKLSGIVELRNTYLAMQPPCLEYEFINGGDLGQLIRQRQWQNSGVPWRDAAKIVLNLAQIIARVHRLTPPIVHRDLKPANILLHLREKKIVLKVADFGIGGIAADRALSDSYQESTRGLIDATIARGSCTPLYASSEQKRGDAPSPRDDIFALGVIWYQMVTGDLGKSAPHGISWKKELVDRSMSTELIEILGGCFESAEYRFADAKVLADRLNILINPPLTDSPPPPEEPITPDPPPSGSAMRVLAARGLIHAGTEIELMPEFRPMAATTMDENIFRASVIDPSKMRHSVRWMFDGELHTPNSLLNRLIDEYGAGYTVGVYRHWRIVGHSKSMTDEANQ